MNDSVTPKWFSFEHRNLYGFKDEPAVSCFLGKLFHYSEVRSAWRGALSKGFRVGDTFKLELHDMKYCIEQARTQGSQWYILELPVLVFAGKENALIVADVNTHRPLSEFSMPTSFDLSVECLGELFQPKKANSVYRIVTKSSVIKPAQFPFLEHRSQTRPRYDPLGWYTSNVRLEIRPLLNIATRICESMQPQPLGHARRA